MKKIKKLFEILNMIIITDNLFSKMFSIAISNKKQILIIFPIGIICGERKWMCKKDVRWHLKSIFSSKIGEFISRAIFLQFENMQHLFNGHSGSEKINECIIIKNKIIRICGSVQKYRLRGACIRAWLNLVVFQICSWRYLDEDMHWHVHYQNLKWDQPKDPSRLG